MERDAMPVSQSVGPVLRAQLCQLLRVPRVAQLVGRAVEPVRN